MAHCTIKFKDGTERRFEDRGAPGGSYNQRIKYEGVFVIVIDAYDNTYAFPSADVAEVQTQPERGRW